MQHIPKARWLWATATLVTVIGLLAFRAAAPAGEQESKAVPIGSSWEDWKYPNPAPLANGSKFFVTMRAPNANDRGVTAGAFVCATADDFDKVLDHYYGKCGIKRGTMESSAGKFSFGPNQPAKAETTLQFRALDCSSQPAWDEQKGQHTPRPVKVHCVFVKTPDFGVSIVVSRVEGEKFSYIALNEW
jgi:hypothetical protein